MTIPRVNQGGRANTIAKASTDVSGLDRQARLDDMEATGKEQELKKRVKEKEDKRNKEEEITNRGHFKRVEHDTLQENKLELTVKVRFNLELDNTNHKKLLPGISALCESIQKNNFLSYGSSDSASDFEFNMPGQNKLTVPFRYMPKFSGTQVEFPNDHLLEFSNLLETTSRHGHARRWEDESENFMTPFGSSMKGRARM